MLCLKVADNGWRITSSTRYTDEPKAMSGERAENWREWHFYPKLSIGAETLILLKFSIEDVSATLANFFVSRSPFILATNLKPFR